MKVIYKILVPINVFLALVLTTIVMTNVTDCTTLPQAKIESNPVGTQIEVFTSNGKLLTAQTVYKKETAIDFCDARLGIYTVRVTKGDNSNVFHYVKK
jgi:hypothetical protein